MRHCRLIAFVARPRRGDGIAVLSHTTMALGSSLRRGVVAS